MLYNRSLEVVVAHVGEAIYAFILARYAQYDCYLCTHIYYVILCIIIMIVTATVSIVYFILQAYESCHH